MKLAPLEESASVEAAEGATAETIETAGDEIGDETATAQAGNADEIGDVEGESEVQETVAHTDDIPAMGENGLSDDRKESPHERSESTT